MGLRDLVLLSPVGSVHWTSMNLTPTFNTRTWDGDMQRGERQGQKLRTKNTEGRKGSGEGADCGRALRAGRGASLPCAEREDSKPRDQSHRQRERGMLELWLGGAPSACTQVGHTGGAGPGAICLHRARISMPTLCPVSVHGLWCSVRIVTTVFFQGLLSPRPCGGPGRPKAQC